MNNFYDNLGLYRDLSACEKDLLAMINFNFFKLDSTWMVRAIDLVSELPSVASFGDVYILESGVYDHTYSIEIFDGVSWQSIEVKNGMHFWIESEKDFFYLEDGVLKTFADTYGDVTGPNYSLNNSIARFDGNTGKFITDSNVTIDDNNNVFGIADIYSEASYSYHSEFNFSYSENLITENLTTNSILGKTTNATLSINTIETSSIFNDLGIEFASSEIESLSHSKNQASNLFLITNKSGDSVFLNKDGNIEYSEDGDLEILNGDTAFILYDLTSNKYRVISTSSGGGSGIGGVDILFADTFEKAKIEDYVTTGIVSLDKVNPIHGLVSMKLTHPNSGYSQYAKTYDIPKAFEGSAMRFKLTVKTNADTDIGSLTINSIYNGDTTHILLSDVKMYDGENVFLLQFPNKAGTFYYNVRAFNEVGNPVTIVDDVVLEKDLGYSTTKDLNVEGSSILMGEIVTGGVHEDESIGEDVILSDLDYHIVELTDSGLISIAGISHAQDFTNFKIWNKTGNVVVFKHDSANAVGREKIFTNSKMPFYLEDNAILEVVTSEDGNIITTKDSPYVQYEQGDESDWILERRGNSGEVITPSVTNIPFKDVITNSTDGMVIYNIDNTFEVMETGQYSITANVFYTRVVSTVLSLFADGASLKTLSSYQSIQLHCARIDMELVKGVKYSLRTYLNSGTLLNVPTDHYLIITRRQMKLKGSVDVTPFVELPETAIITEWQRYYPQIKGTVTDPTPDPNHQNLTFWRRVGAEMEIRYNFYNDGAGSAGSGSYMIPIPDGYEVDTQKISAFNFHNGDTIVGYGSASSPTTQASLRVNLVTSSMSALYGNKAFAMSYARADLEDDSPVGSSYYGLDADVVYSVMVSIPIKGWSAPNLVAVADTGKIGEVIFSGNPSAPKGFISTDNKTIGTTGDYNSYKYFELYKQIWNFPSLSTVATDAYSISSAKGASAEADWGAGKLIRVNFTENEVFIRAKGSARDLGSYEADEVGSHLHDQNLGEFNGTGSNVGLNATGASTTGLSMSSGVGTYTLPRVQTALSTGTETRPKNVALNAYIRYSADLQIYVNKMPKRYIVETYQSGSDWYEVNNDGWVRQSIRSDKGAHNANTATVSLPIAMKDNTYTPTVVAYRDGANSADPIIDSQSTTQVTLGPSGNGNSWKLAGIIVEGYGDSAAVKALGATPDY